MKRYVWMGCAAAAVVAAAIVFAGAVAGQGRERGSREEVERRGGERPEPVVLRFVHIPAQSFMQTLEQLGQNDRLHEALRQMPVALNEPANAVVIIAPPELADILRGVAEELDQPNEFAEQVRQRQREDILFGLQVEERKRALDRDDMGARVRMGAMKRRLAGPPKMGPGTEGPPSGMMPKMGPGPEGPSRGMMPRMGFGRGGMGRGPMGRMGPGQQGPRPGMPPMMGPGQEGPPPGMPPRMGLGQGGMRRGPMAGMGPGPQGPRPGMPPMMGPGPEGPPPPEREQQMQREREDRDRQMDRERKEQEQMDREREGRGGEDRDRQMDRERKEREQMDRERERRGGGDERERQMDRERKEQEQMDRERERRGGGEDRERQMDRERKEREQMDRERERRGGGDERERQMDRERKEQEQMDRERERRGGGDERERQMDRERQMQREREDRGGGEREQMQRERKEREPDRDERPRGPGPPGERGAGTPPEGRRPVAQEVPARFHLIQDVVVEGVVVVGDGGGTVTIEAVPGASVHIAVPEGQGGAGVRVKNPGPVDEARHREMVERARATYLFRMLSDPDIRSELGLSAEQEAKIAALVEKEARERERIKDDVRMQFGGDRAGTDPEAHEREMVRQTWQAMRDAQPRFDQIGKEAADTLTEEQKTRLDQVVRERYRLMAACGDLWVLVTAGARESLGLDDAQAAGIRKVLVEAADRLDAQRKVAFESAKDVPTEQRAEAMRAMWEGFRKARDESIAASRERVFSLLTDAQKPKAEKFLAETKTNAGRLWNGATVQPLNIGRAERARPTLASAPAARWSTVAAVYEGGARFVPAAKGAGPADRAGPPDRPRAGATLRLLEEPAVRAELNLTADQEKRIFVIQEKARRLLDRIRAETREQLGDRPRRNPDDVDRRELKRRAAEVSAEAMRAAAPELDSLAKEAADVLTADQRAKLDELGRDRAHFLRATGGLAALLLPGARQRVGITDPQAERIRAILEETAKAAKTLNEGPAGGTPDTRKRRQADLVREARDRIMQALEPDQRDKAHQFLTEMEGSRPGQPKRRGPPEAESATKGYGQAI